MGPSVAKELMFTARVFNGAEASKVRLNVYSVLLFNLLHFRSVPAAPSDSVVLKC